ncbi:salicylate hydroxylase [Hypoxylon crocopeplum]|nr:salicylate hydroxylase [Hypoxylon crocopeplum]
MASSNNFRVRIAIIGGGLAGTALANALIQIPHLEIQVYESAPSFSERGAAVALGPNALQALEQILPDGKYDIMNKAGAVPLNSARNVVGSGPNVGKIIFETSDPEPGVVVHRASLLRELVAPLPKESLHINKKLAAINLRSSTNAVEVVFEDGTANEFDAVIGADGIFGLVRSYVLGDDADKFAASPAGFWDCRNLVPLERAKAVLGDELFEVDRQCGWVGDGGFLMHDVLENRTMVQCVMSAVEHSPTRDRKRALSREILTQTFSDWLDGPIAKGMIELSLEQDDLQGYSQWEHKATPTYANGRVCVIGDAAHATTPWQGSGAAMAFEDAMVLRELLANITCLEDIGLAFKAYDVLRRPRCQRIIDSSRETGMILCGRDVNAGLDPEKLLEVLAPRWDFIEGLDMSAHKEEALHIFKEMRRS